MTPSKLDAAFYYLLENKILVGLSGTYVDDLLRAGNRQFRQNTTKTTNKFDMTKDSPLPFKHTDFSLSRDSENNVIIDQHHYLRKLECVPLGSAVKSFRSIRMKLAWLSKSRPDCLFEIAQLAQVTEEMFLQQPSAYIRRLNKAIKYATDNRIALKIPKLHRSSLRIVGFSDASFAKNSDLSSQLGYVIFLGDQSNNVVPIVFRSYKARRITRSAMDGEVIAFSDMFDYAIAL